MAYQINLTGQEIDERLQNIGTAEDVAAADGTLYARISKNADDVDELRDTVGHIDSAQTATDKTVTQHTADISTLQTALKTKANLVDGKVSSEELPIVTSLKQDDYTTIPSAKLVDEVLTAVGNTLEEKINNKVVGLLHWQGVKDTTDEIKSITSAKKGDVWHSNGDGSEWVCTEDISTVNDSAWTELGTPIDLSGYYTKNEVDKKVKPLADSIGTDSDAASANGSVYARIKKNAADIATKASNSDLAALQSKVELKVNQSDINGALIQKLTTASTEAEIRKAFTEVNTKTVLFPTPGSIISKLDGNNKGIVVSLSGPDATTLGRTITVYHGNDTYTIIVKSDFTKVLMPWTKISSKRNVYSSDIIYATSDLSEADIKGLFTPRAYKKYNIVFPVKPQTGDLVEETDGDESRFTTNIALRNEKNPTEYTDIFIPVYGIDNRYYRIVLKNDLTSVQSYDGIVFKNYRRCYNGEALLALDTVKAETIENSITDAYVYSVEDTPSGLTEQLPEVGDLIETEGDFAPVCEVFLDSDDVQHTRWFSKGKLYEVTVNTALTRVPEDPKVIYDTTSGTLRDLYISAGAVYNERTGYYELNGLTDITEEEMRVIYEKTWGWWLHLPSLNGFGSALPRTNIPCPDYKIISYASNINLHSIFSVSGNNDNLEVVNLRALYTPTSFDEIKIVDFNWAFQGSEKIREVQGIINVKEARGKLNIGGNIETINIKGLKVDIRFYNSQRLSKESVLYMINNSEATSAITISLNKAVYDVMKDDADIIAALAEKTNITLIQKT